MTRTSEDDVLTQLLGHDLVAALESLQAAEEELHQQHEELGAAQGALDRERLRYRSLFDEAPVPYLVTGFDGMIREANRAAVELLGVERGELTRQALMTYVAPDDRRAFREQLAGLPRDGHVIAFTHGGLVRAAVIEAVFPGDDRSPPPPGLTGAVMWRLDVDPPSVTELSGHVAGGTVAWRLVRLNWTPSLRGAPGGGAPGGVPPITDG